MGEESNNLDDITKEAASLNQQIASAAAFAEAPAPTLVFGEAPAPEAIELSLENRPEQVSQAVIDDLNPFSCNFGINL